MEDFEKRCAVGAGQIGKIRALVFPAQDFSQPAVDIGFDPLRHFIEGLAVNKVTQRITEQSGLEIQIPQGSPVAVARALTGEFGGEVRRAPDRRRQRRSAGEKHRLDKRLTHVSRSGPGLSARESDQVVHLGLMCEHHQRNDVAVWA